MNVDTGIIIRAEIEGRVESVDIGDERVSGEELTRWMRIKGGANPWAENLVLSFLHKEQIAQNVPYFVDPGYSHYQNGGSLINVVAHDDFIRLAIKQGDHISCCDIPKTHPRVYNMMIQLIKGMQVHHEESPD